MTDPTVADAVYLEPLTVDAIEAVIAREKPEGLLAGPRRPDGAQPRDGARGGRRPRAARRPAPGHAARGDPHGRGPRGVPRPARPDRPAVRAVVHRRGARTRTPGTRRPRRRSPTIGLPAIIRPAFTLGGTGGGIVETEDGLLGAGPGRPPGEPDQAGDDRALPRRLAGDRVRGHARRRGHVHRRVLDGERGPAGRPHRRLDRGGAGPDADRPGPPAAAAARRSRSSARSASRAAATSSSRCRPTRPSTP